MIAEPGPRVQAIRARIDHPVIDCDGHTIEFMPMVREELKKLGGQSLVDGMDTVFNANALTRGLGVDMKRALGLFRLSWWAFPTRNTLDRASAMLPKLQYERLDELGIDFAVLYPTLGLATTVIDEPELRCGMARAFNRFYAEGFGEFSDRLTHVAIIPMHTPEEAIEELEYAVGTLGMKAAVLSGFAFRPVEGEDIPRVARWLDTFGLDSPHDYDPVWAKCVELGISPTFHSSAMGWYRGSSMRNYMYNHIGNFAVAGETMCRSLFFDGVPKRFPELNFSFLEGGVGWGCNLYSDLIGHYEKRGGGRIDEYDPKHLDHALMRDLFQRFGSQAAQKYMDELPASLSLLSDPDEDRSQIDEFARSGVECAEDIRDIFVNQFYFGCEADDPINAMAFDTRMNPLGASQNALFSSDIGHWDVPDTREVLGEAFELVDDELLSEADFRRFVYENPRRFHTRANPRFFHGTVIEEGEAAQNQAE